MFGGHFYHETIRRSVAVFGTIFNNISIVRKDNTGEVKSIVKVPLAYGPKQKFLARIEEQAALTDQKVAIKLPRMSFEITSLTYDPQTKLQKGTKQTITANGTTRNSVMGPVTYRMGMQLNIMTKNQDDALQIIEQILPFFQPDYTVTVKQVNDNIKSDMPIVLQGVQITDDYEGDFSTRRAIVYTLDFETRVRFYGDTNEGKVIRKTLTEFRDSDDKNLLERQLVILNPFDASEDDPYTIDVSYAFSNVPDEIQLEVDDASELSVDDVMIGSTSLSSGQIKLVNDSNNNIIIYKPDGLFEVGETITVKNSAINTTVINTTEIWYE